MKVRADPTRNLYLFETRKEVFGWHDTLFPSIVFFFCKRKLIAMVIDLKHLMPLKLVFVFPY